jgi:hypothetical protein
VLGGSVVAFIVSVSLFIPDKPPEMAVTPQVETVTPQIDTVARPVRAPATAMPALPAKDEPLPNPTVGSPGIARVCLRGNDIHLTDKDEIIIPDGRISRIRLSDKTSRLHPRHVVSKRS